MATTGLDGISVITSTIRKSCTLQIISNFMKQKFAHKELIIVINNDEMQPFDFKLSEEMQKSIHIYQLPSCETLGQCLNMGIEKAKYNYIAKFDDDDYYSKLYLEEMYGAFKREACDVVCKRSIFYYLEGHRELVLLSASGQNKRVTKGAGATIGARRDIFNSIQFEKLKVGTDSHFFKKCLQYGLKCYSTSSYNYLCFRGKEVKQHTWLITEDEIKNNCLRCFSKPMSYVEACEFVSYYKK